MSDTAQIIGTAMACFGFFMAGRKAKTDESKVVAWIGFVIWVGMVIF